MQSYMMEIKNQNKAILQVYSLLVEKVLFNL